MDILKPRNCKYLIAINGKLNKEKNRSVFFLGRYAITFGSVAPVSKFIEFSYLKFNDLVKTDR